MDISGAATDRTLRMAAQVALNAPSILNTQPWLWTVMAGEMRLHADRSRQLRVTDPGGRLLIVSCGAALHHARLALAVAGWQADIELLPTAKDPDLLAIIRIAGPHSATLGERTAYAAISHRRTDRRAFTAEPVPAEMIESLQTAVEREGARLTVLSDNQVEGLAALADLAGEAQRFDPAYQRELEAWTTSVPEAPANAAGVPAQTAVAPAARRVPVRDLAPRGPAGLQPGDQSDAGATYGVLITDDDSPAAWLRAGQAMSALLLTATSEGLGSAPISDITEVTQTRRQLQALLDDSGVPQLAVRVGFPPAGQPPASPRRSLGEVVNLWP